MQLSTKKLFGHHCLYISERPRYTCQNIETKNRVLFPAFVFVIKNIIYLHPAIQLGQYFKFHTCINIEGRFKFSVTHVFKAIVWAVPKEEITFNRKIFHYFPS